MNKLMNECKGERGFVEIYGDNVLWTKVVCIINFFVFEYKKEVNYILKLNISVCMSVEI